MSFIGAAYKRLWYGLNPEIRKSRFHTQKGQFTLSSLRSIADCAAALTTGVARRVFDIRPVLPWITFPAMRFVRSRVGAHAKVFEWGSGVSTLWFEQRCGEAHAVEDNPNWHAAVAARAKRARVHVLSGRAYNEKILEFPPGHFDVISIDGSHRHECFRLAVDRLAPGGMLVVDNSDNDRTTGGDLFVIDGMLESLGRGWQVHRFPGWGPENFFAWETTVCVRR